MKNAREAAMLILCKIDYDGAYSNIALKTVLGGFGLDARDKAFATQLVYGVQTYRITLDYIISRYSSVKLKKLSKFVAELLRLALFQLLYCDRVPDSAAVNESVKLAARYAPKSRGFVNGVLRSFIRDGKAIAYPADETAAMSVKYSFPEEICAAWRAEFGAGRAERLMSALNGEPKMTVRSNITKTDVSALKKTLEAEGAACSENTVCGASLDVSGLDVGASRAFGQGLFSVQDAAASLAVEVLCPRPGDSVIDVCAAPGGKSAYAAELMNNRGSVRAFDIHPHKLALIEENAKRLGLDIIKAECADASEFNPGLEKSADKLIADVPCSGFGIIRRKPDIKYSMTERGEINRVQSAILENCSRYVKPGGELVYSTCTVERAENEAVTEDFLSRHGEFERVDISGMLPAQLRRESAAEGYITLYPDTDGTDGFYICKMKRK